MGCANCEDFIKSEMSMTCHFNTDITNTDLLRNKALINFFGLRQLINELTHFCSSTQTNIDLV